MQTERNFHGTRLPRFSEREQMETDALKRMRSNLKATLTKMEKASSANEDTSAMAELKASVRSRIASLDDVLRQGHAPSANRERMNQQ